MVPPHIHRRNSAECENCTFKAYFLSILAGIARIFPNKFLDLLIPETELTLNLLIQSTLNPKISAWEYFQGTFNYKSTPLGSLGYLVMINWKTSNCKSWDSRGNEGWIICVTLDHYQCQRIIPHDTKADKISDTVELYHQTITTPVVIPKDRILHGITMLINSLADAPTAQSYAQLQAITTLKEVSASWSSPDETSAPTATILLPTPEQTRRSIRVQKIMLKHPKLQHPIPPIQLQWCLTNLRCVSHFQGC